MSKIDSFLVRAALDLVILAFAGLAAYSQSTIFNIPTSDALSRGSWNCEADRTSAIVYGNTRKTISPLRGMTLTGGVYSVFRGNREFGTRTGVMLGAVQPVNKRFSFVADWFSGRNRLGYASAGLNWNITNR